MKSSTQGILIASSLALPLLLGAAILLFPVTAWKAWGDINELFENHELAQKANARAWKMEIERDFKKHHGEEGVWVAVSDAHYTTACILYCAHIRGGGSPTMTMPDGSEGFYILKRKKHLFTVENLEGSDPSELQESPTE